MPRRPAGSRRRWRQRRNVLLALVAVIAGGGALLARATNVTRRLEESSIDARFTIRGRAPLPGNLALVGIGASTFNYFRHAGLPSQWPFPRRYYARVIDNLHRAGARVIAIDIQFTEPTDEHDDLALYNAVAAAGHVVLGTSEVAGDGQTAILGGNANLAAARALPGDTNFPVDDDGVIRSTTYAIHGLRTFAVAVAQADGHRVPRSLFGAGPVPIDFAYPAGDIHPIPLSDVWSGRIDPARFRGKIVFIGATAPTLQDIHATPVDPLMAGVELQADATNTVLHGLPLSYASALMDVLLTLAFGLALPLVSIRLSTAWVLAGALVAGTLYLVAAQLAFAAGLVVDVVDPMLALVIAAIGCLAVLYLVETVERERVHNLFARFVPPGVVDQVLARTDENLRLGAVESDCTVLFSDLRGFTAFSETQSPATVIAVVNYYLEQMTEAILDAGGTLIAYMGDGIMAVFGAPIEQPDHADRALTAAREMLGPRLQRFNAWMVGEGHHSGFRMGVGLHSGTVMAGNVGSDERLDYTAIGDTTNTASRLEGLTKGSGYMLLFSSATRERLAAAPDDVVFVDDVEIRGRAGRIELWSIVSALAEPTPPGDLPGPDDQALAK